MSENNDTLLWAGAIGLAVYLFKDSIFGNATTGQQGVLQQIANGVLPATAIPSSAIPSSASVPTVANTTPNANVIQDDNAVNALMAARGISHTEASNALYTRDTLGVPVDLYLAGGPIINPSSAHGIPGGVVSQIVYTRNGAQVSTPSGSPTSILYYPGQPHSQLLPNVLYPGGVIPNGFVTTYQIPDSEAR